MADVASLTIRNIPRDVLARLKARATANRRSMQSEVLQILEAAAREPASRLGAADVLERVRSLNLTTPAESADMIRADRNGR